MCGQGSSSMSLCEWCQGLLVYTSGYGSRHAEWLLTPAMSVHMHMWKCFGVGCDCACNCRSKGVKK